MFCDFVGEEKDREVREVLRFLISQVGILILPCVSSRRGSGCGGSWKSKGTGKRWRYVLNEEVRWRIWR